MNDQIPAWIINLQTFGWQGMLQVVIAAALGGFIGFERERRGHDAGLRTNMLISMGACLFTILSIYGFPLKGSTSQDTARIAAQVVTGVGFLGAGAFIHGQGRTKGMTTAATIWMVAAIGMTVGVRAYGLALFSSTFTFFILRFLHPVSVTLAKRDESSNQSS